MSAYDTKKRGADKGVQLTFPSVYEAVEFMRQAPKQYAPSPVPVLDNMVGHDFFANYHERKHADAYQQVLNRIHNNRSIEKMLHSHQNYYGMPKPVLGQRVFANPSNGAAGIGGDLYPARRDDREAPFNCIRTGKGMVGGVLFTKAGREYAKRVLKNRKEELDQIDATEIETTSEVPSTNVTVAETKTPSEFGDSSKVEFNLLRQNIIDAVESNKVDKLVLGDVSKMLALLFRYASTGDSTDLEDILAGFENLVDNIEALIESNSESGADSTLPPLRTALSLFRRALDYAQEMFKGLSLSPSERQDLSKALIKKYNFGKLVRTATPVVRPELRVAEIPPPAGAAAEAEAAPPKVGVSADETSITLSDGRTIANDFSGYSLPAPRTRNIFAVIDDIPLAIKKQIILAVSPSARVNVMSEKTVRSTIKRIIDGKKV